MKPSKLFQECAYEIQYETTGFDVNYAFKTSGNTLYIYFQGSSSWIDWFRNFFFAKKIYKKYKVHRGFYNAYSEVRNIILDKVYQIYKQDLKVVVVGYSHGSAVSQIAHEDLVYHFPNLDIKTYAFESPRAFKVRKKYRDVWKNMVVIEDNWDIVCHLPPKLFGFSDLGKRLKIKGDISLVKNCLPKCIKSHYPECVLDGLLKFEKHRQLVFLKDIEDEQ